MSATEFQLRSAAFGGFNRQDVLNYIEASTKEYSAQISDLSERLSAAEADRESAQTDLRAAREMEKKHIIRCGELAEETQKKNDALADLMAQLEAERAQVRAQREEAARLTELLDRAAPLAQAYEHIKDRAATIEMEAHQRAQTTIDQANAEVRALYAEIEQWLFRVRQDYDALRTEVDATLSHTAGELERLQRDMTELAGNCAIHDREMEEFIDAVGKRLRQGGLPTG